MIYVLIDIEGGGQGYMELFNGTLVRVTDMDGNTISPDVYSLSDAAPTPPAWALPDPAPETPPAPVDPVPAVITKRQFLIQLLRAGMVQDAEVPTLAIQPPAAVASIFAGLPSEASLEVSLTWAAMTEVERANPLLAMAVQANLMTDADLDDFFRAAALI